MNIPDSNSDSPILHGTPLGASSDSTMGVTQPGKRLRRLLDVSDSEHVEPEVLPPVKKAGPLSVINQDQEQDIPVDMTVQAGEPEKQPVESDTSQAQQPQGNVSDWLREVDDPEKGDIAETRAARLVDLPVPLDATTAIDLTRLSGRYEHPTIPPVGGSSSHLPSRVDEVDLSATQVTAAAYSPPRKGTHQRRLSARSISTRKTAKLPGKQAGTDQTDHGMDNIDWRKGLSCLVRLGIALVFLILVGFLGVLSFLVFKYYSIATSLPSVDDLRSKASQFETTRILDRNGNLLYEILDPNAGRRTYIPIDKISPYLVAATISVEDKEYYNHPGFDPVALLRALWQNYTSGEIVSGASTITQQLARNLLFSPEERVMQSYERKAREIVLAAEITRRYSKDEILELYLNENFYGKFAYGIEAAAETYFSTTAGKLSLSQAAFLAGLPQSPAIYDIETNREATLSRFRDVLVLMFQNSLEKGCVVVSNTPQPVCVDAVSVSNAAKEIDAYPFRISQGNMTYPHWVTYVRWQLEQRYDSQTIYRSGFTIYTTLDPGLQKKAEEIVARQVEKLADRHVTNGALVLIRPGTGEILAMVGSADFYNASISGQVNMAVAPRQPGSSIKPLTYAAAFEKGWNPATLIWDVASDFPPSGDAADTRPPYQPVNYDERFHGPVLVRDALANSYNIPAVKALDFVGIYDNPATPQAEGLIAFAKRMGITTFTREDYGLALTLGGGDVSLLELTSAYSNFANGGRRIPPVAITRILDFQGNEVYRYTAPAGEQVLRAEHAFLISSILSDNAARTPMFGQNSVLNLPFQVAVKTGTTNEFKDNWTVGYTPDLALGVWVGNADNTPMQNTTGLTGAAPIWAEFMQEAIQVVTGGNLTPFTRPAGVVDKVVCSVSGTEPSEWCPSQRGEIFAYDQLPLAKEQDLWQKVKVDTWTGFKASAFCSDFTDDKMAMNVQDKWAKQWLMDTQEGRDFAERLGFSQPIFFVPERECLTTDSRPVMVFSNFTDGQVINSVPLDIYIVAYVDQNFEKMYLDWGKGDQPTEWHRLIDNISDQYRQPERIFSWDMKKIPNGSITLRLVMNNTQGRYAERRIRLEVRMPTSTPTFTPSSTATFTLTPTPTQTNTPVPTNTPLPTNTVTDTPVPSETPTPIP
jgi:penicillin-binding protein 1C